MDLMHVYADFLYLYISLLVSSLGDGVSLREGISLEISFFHFDILAPLIDFFKMNKPKPKVFAF